MTELTILGTASMVPTKERNVQAFALEHEGEIILIDCGEGTQRQMQMAGLSRAKIRKILITHWHGDHVAGLVGLVQTMGNVEYEGALHVFGPRGTKERFFHLMNSSIFESRIDIKIHELIPEATELLEFLETEDYALSCIPVDHGVPSLAYLWRQKDRTRVDMAACAKLGLKEGPLIGKLSRGETVEVDGKRVMPKDVTYRVTGKRVAFIPDTQPHPNLTTIAEGADVLVCESTFSMEEEHKAQEFRHMTAAYAAQVASRAEVKRLILTHFSQRYVSVQHLLEEARAIFPNSETAFDLMKVTL